MEAQYGVAWRRVEIQDGVILSCVLAENEEQYQLNTYELQATGRRMRALLYTIINYTTVC
jgi:hypothetical protein